MVGINFNVSSIQNERGKIFRRRLTFNMESFFDILVLYSLIMVVAYRYRYKKTVYMVQYHYLLNKHLIQFLHQYKYFDINHYL